jgi:hypothetical protein
MPFSTILQLYRGSQFYWLDLQLPVQSVPITTKVVSSNPVHGKVYSIQHYVIKFVSDLRQVNQDGVKWNVVQSGGLMMYHGLMLGVTLELQNRRKK